MHPARADLSLPNVLYALGDPLRLKIVEQVAAAEEAMSCGDFFAGDGVAKSTQSHHFKVLRESGLIRMVSQGRRVLVSLRREDLDARFPGLLDSVLQSYRRR
jgi:DNA-binding transcriptional ArsR family regulator